MNLRISLRFTLSVFIALSFQIKVSAQGATSSNPGEWAVIRTGESNLLNTIKKQSDDMALILGTQSEMVIANTKMKTWQEKYDSYISTASGYASSIKATTTLYFEGMQTLQALWELKTAMKINPQGIAASIPMTDIYLETLSKFVEVYGALKKVIAKGGSDNMLSGSERTLYLWSLNDDLEELNNHIHRLALSVGMYTFEDVWNRAIEGKIDKTPGQLAHEASKRMNRAMTLVSNFYKQRQTHKTWFD